MVALELGAGPVAVEAVELDDEVGARPDRVDEPARDGDVERRDREVVALAEGEQDLLELAAGVRQLGPVVLEGVVDRRGAPDPAAGDGVDRRGVEDALVVGVGECEPKEVAGGVGGEVDEGLVGRGDGEAAVGEAVDVAPPADVLDCARSRRSARGADVRRFVRRPLEQAEPPDSRPVAERRSGPGVQERLGELRFDGRHEVTDGIDAGKGGGVEVGVGDPGADRRLRCAKRPELIPANAPELPRGHRRDANFGNLVRTVRTELPFIAAGTAARGPPPMPRRAMPRSIDPGCVTEQDAYVTTLWQESIRSGSGLPRDRRWHAHGRGSHP